MDHFYNMLQLFVNVLRSKAILSSYWAISFMARQHITETWEMTFPKWPKTAQLIVPVQCIFKTNQKIAAQTDKTGFLGLFIAGLLLN